MHSIFVLYSLGCLNCSLAKLAVLCRIIKCIVHRICSIYTKTTEYSFWGSWYTWNALEWFSFNYLQNCLLNLFIIIHEIRYILIYFESNEKHNFAEKIPTISITSIKKVNLLILINETVLSMEFSKSNFISVVINKSLGFERREGIHVWNTRCFLLVLFFNLR